MGGGEPVVKPALPAQLRGRRGKPREKFHVTRNVELVQRRAQPIVTVNGQCFADRIAGVAEQVGNYIVAAHDISLGALQRAVDAAV